MSVPVEDIWHRESVEWWQAPLPRRWHRCTPQTVGEVGRKVVERCACGAIRTNGVVWGDKNARRHTRNRRGPS